MWRARLLLDRRGSGKSCAVDDLILFFLFALSDSLLFHAFFSHLLLFYYTAVSFEGEDVDVNGSRAYRVTVLVELV